MTPAPAMREHLALLALLLTMVFGCGYRVDTVVGEDRNRLRVTVEPFANRTQPYEPFIEERLHQAVLNQIMPGPYQLTDPEQADLYVTGRIILFRQNVLSQDVNNEPTEVQLTMQVEITVKDLRHTSRPVSERWDHESFTETLDAVSEPFVIDRGETLADAADRAYRSLARQIVDHFTHPKTRPWKDEDA